MENNTEQKDPQNGSAQPSTGASVREGTALHGKNEINEDKASKLRPEFGGEGGKNTSNSQQQLPSLTDGGAPGSDADKDGVEELGDQQTGSDADADRGGAPSI